MHRTNKQKQHPNPKQIPNQPPNKTTTKPHHPNQPRKTNPTNHHQQIRPKHTNKKPQTNPTNNTPKPPKQYSTAHLIFTKITNHYHLNQILTKTFNPTTTKDILSIAWYLTSEANALNDPDNCSNTTKTPKDPP